MLPRRASPESLSQTTTCAGIYDVVFSNGGEESACGWCKDRLGISWQITPRVLTDAFNAGGAEAKRAFAAMMEMGKVDVAKIEAARRG
jgi:predicted 3-demethylubiquinone-9 3-methyltransferase (glyoxalase superfamily)